MRARPRTILSPAQAQVMAAEFIAARRWHGTATMRLDAPPADQPPADTPPADTPPADQPPADDERTKPKFSIEELDQHIAKRVNEEKVRWQKKLDDATALAGKSETDKLTIERDQAKAAAAETTQKAAQRIAQTEAKVAAIAAGANPDRLGVIVKNTDLAEAVDGEGNVDEAKVKALVEKTLTDFPEWKKTTGTGPSASGGELNGGQAGKPTFTRKQIEEMSDDERVKRIDEINEAMADGRVTG